MACFEHALTALPRVPENQAQREQAIDLRLEMRNVLIVLGDFRRMFALLSEAETLAQALEDHQRLGWVSAYLNPYFFNIGDLYRAIETAQRALTIAQSCGDFALASACCMLPPASGSRPCGAVDSYRDVSGHGDDLLAPSD